MSEHNIKTAKFFLCFFTVCITCMHIHQTGLSRAGLTDDAGANPVFRFEVKWQMSQTPKNV